MSSGVCNGVYQSVRVVFVCDRSVKSALRNEVFPRDNFPLMRYVFAVGNEPIFVRRARKHEDVAVFVIGLGVGIVSAQRNIFYRNAVVLVGGLVDVAHDRKQRGVFLIYKLYDFLPSSFARFYLAVRLCVLVVNILIYFRVLVRPLVAAYEIAVSVVAGIALRLGLLHRVQFVFHLRDIRVESHALYDVIDILRFRVLDARFQRLFVVYLLVYRAYLVLDIPI